MQRTCRRVLNSLLRTERVARGERAEHLGQCTGCRRASAMRDRLLRAGMQERARDLSPLARAETRDRARTLLRAREAVATARAPILTPRLVYAVTLAGLLAAAVWVVQRQWTAHPYPAGPGLADYEVRIERLEYRLIDDMDAFRTRYLARGQSPVWEREAGALRYRLAVAAAAVRHDVNGW